MQTSSFQPTHFTCLYATKSSNYFEMLTLLFVFVPPVSVLYLSVKKVSLNAEAGRGPGQLDPFSVHGNKNGTLLYIFVTGAEKERGPTGTRTQGLSLTVRALYH